MTNACDYNVYGGVGADTAWQIEQPERKVGFEEWREEMKFDVHGCAAEMAVTVDRAGGEIRLAGKAPIAAMPRLRFITRDLAGEERTGESAVAGPFAGRIAGCASVVVGGCAVRRSVNPA
jgi:hypothetical protein